MLERLWLALASTVILVLIIGCAGGRGVRRAPVDAIPEDVDAETRIQLLEEMVLTFPEDAHLFYEIGNLYYDQLLPGEARTNYERALALDPDLNKARVNLAMVLAETDEADSAKTLLKDAIRRNPSDTKAYNNLGMVYYTDLDVNNAVKYFTMAIELEPDNLEAHYNLGLAFAESGLLLEAIQEWRTVLGISEEGETADRARLSLDRAEREMKK